MKLRTLHDWVVIEREPDRVEEYGLFLRRSYSNQGVVLAVGSNVQGIEVGGRLQFNAYGGLVITTEEIVVTLMRPVDIVENCKMLTFK